MIPLSVPNLAGNEWQYVKDCLDTNWVSSVGSYVDRFEQQSAAYNGVAAAVATSNGTAALHISLLLAGVKQHDLVLTANITFISPVNVITYLGAEPVLVDVDPETWQMDMELVASFLANETVITDDVCFHAASGKRIGAIMPVHILGNMCDMERALELGKKYNIPVIEDATEALGSTYNGKHAGSMGFCGCLSYNGNKIITTGGGGMILFNDAELAKKAKHLTTQAKSDPYEYVHDEIGYNYRLVNILAALGVAQMEQLPGFVARKKEIAARYTEKLKTVPGVKAFQQLTPGTDANCWLYTVAFENQQALAKHLLAEKIQVRPLWVPMNQLPMFSHCTYINANDRSGNLYGDCLSLPCSTGITNEEIDRVCEQITAFYMR